MSIYITSDLHFFHHNILKFCQNSRPFSTIDEMHDTIINNWNNLITPDDITYILGDVTFGKISLTIDILNQLNGRKVLIKGNHDKDAIRKEAFCNCFESIHDYLEIKYDGITVVLFHFPIMSWNLKHHRAIHLHGHLHNNPSNVPGRIKDVGLDTNFCKPYLLNDIIQELSLIPLNTDHHGRVIE